MLSISKFAKECRTTVKTIRHYDNIGLLKADYVSDNSGYRYYRRSSVAKFYQILAFKNSGFTLSEIRNIANMDITENLRYIEQKILLLKKQQNLCESIKKEYEKIMAETKKFKVSLKNQEISILRENGVDVILINASPNVAGECAAMLESSLNAEQIINVDYDDLKQIVSNKTAVSVGCFYSPDCRCDEFDDISINSRDEKATDLVVFFEASPDTAPQKISEAIQSFLLSFAADVNVIFSANAESGEKGLTLKWICFK